MEGGGEGGEGPSVEVGADPNPKLCRFVLAKKRKRKKKKNLAGCRTFPKGGTIEGFENELCRL